MSPLEKKDLLFPTSEIEALRLASKNKNKQDTILPSILETLNFNSLPRSSSSPSRISNKPLLTGALQEFDYPLNECFTYTFKLTVGSETGKTFLKETFTSDEGMTYLVGQVLTTPGKRNGLIQQLDHQANITWSKSLDYPGRNSMVQSIRQLTTGNLIMIGTSELPDGSDKRIFVAELNTTGNLIWSRSLSYPGYSGMGISATATNGIAFCGNDDSTVVYGKMDYLGNLTSLKRIRLMEKGSVVGMTKNDYNAWYIAYSGIDSARRVGILMQISWTDATIDYINKFGGRAANSDFIFHDLELINIRPRVSGIYSMNNGPYKLFKVTGNVTGQYESIQTFDVPGVIFDVSAKTTLTPWAEVIAFSATSTDPNVYLVKTINESNPSTMIHWTKKFEGLGQHELVNIERGFDGGFLIANNRATINGTQGYILKTDSIGVLKNCEGVDFDISNNMEYSGIVATLNPVALSTASSMLQNNIVTADLTSPNLFECKNLSCPVVLPEDSCITSFARRYRSASFCDLGLDMLVEEQNKTTIAAITRDNPYEPQTQKAVLAVFNQTGKLQERKKIRLGNATVIQKMLRMKDGNLLVLGNSTYKSAFTGIDTGYITISKFSPDLQLIWNQSFPFSSPYSAIYGILESSDGSIFVNYVEGRNFCDDISLIKLNSQGGLEWCKNYSPAGKCIIGYVGSITQDNDHVYIMNWSTTDVILLKIIKSTGALAWSKGFIVPGANQTHIARNISFLGDNLVVQGTVTALSADRSVVMTIDRNGNLKQARSFSKEDRYFYFDMVVTQNRQLVLASSDYYHGNFIRLDSNLNIIYSKQVQITASGSRKIAEGLDGGIYDLGYFWYSNAYENDISLKKYSFDGLMGSCFADTLAVVTAIQPIIQTDLSSTTTDNTVNLQSLPYREESYSLQENELLCSKVATCDQLELFAPTGVCDTLYHTISAKRNIACKAPVYFSYSSNDFKIISRTDTSLIVQFINSGSTIFKAKIFTGCKWIEDSIVINASPVYRSVNLGSDTTLCPSNSIYLNAHRGYTSYLWNDGSVDSVITVHTPGKYYVVVSDACGNYFSDTIIVTAAPPIPFNIGPDRFKCNNDTLHINAPGSFLNYAWGPAYNISSANGQQVVVQPAKDTAYFVKAEKTPGCFAYDTVKIKVFQSPPIDLGGDQRFCAGDSALLNAGNGFVNYTWNNGSTSPQIYVHTSGDYSVVGTTAEGCNSYDALQIIEVWNNPVVSLDNESGLCTGSARVLQAGNFSSYRWQDGSTSSTFTANTIGTYYVTVWDNNQCKGSDTTYINKLLPLPANFLPADTFICNYASLDIKANAGYRNYIWSNSAVTSSISVTIPGTYWLQVIDANNCTGKDSIEVNPKDCLTGFYIPSAFTPNNDGLNDFFKPFIGGNLKQYQFTIYNRWGQVVFSTKEINKGWDGWFNATIQDSHVFAWSCIYKLEGEPFKKEKGTVTLIR